YLVVPESLVDKCLMVKDALSGDTPSHIQAAMADFISEGSLLRHIRKMRRVYKSKHEQVCFSIQHYFGDKVRVISQAAGLHVTLSWQQGIDENTWTQRAKKAGIVMRPVSFYEHPDFKARDWQGVVIGYGNVRLDNIDPLIKRLFDLFDV
ncbi:PLP-dependent aminotransferase family protein, partial [Vibrio sp. 1287]|nr:PLP-dependent aminotransferase family protein [Vibrio sp. 1287]